MYRGEPSTTSSRVIAVAALSACSAPRARPKSSSLTPWGVRKMFAGFRSRCTMPRSCTTASASSTAQAIGHDVGVGQRSAREARRERLPGQQFHDEEIHPVLLAHVMNRADVRVIERRDGAGLPLEAFPPLGISGHGRRQHFDGNITPEPGIVRPIDLAHPACAERAADHVWSERGAVLECHGAGVSRKARERDAANDSQPPLANRANGGTGYPEATGDSRPVQADVRAKRPQVSCPEMQEPRDENRRRLAREGAVPLYLRVGRHSPKTERRPVGDSSTFPPVGQTAQ